jgi:small subunit ribosomal protein S8
MATDVIGDFLTIIRNGIMVAKPSVTMFHSKIRESILQILKDEGFIRDFAASAEGTKKYITVHLKYVNRESVIHELVRVSTPGLRRYVGSDEIKPVIGGLGVSILTTNKGILSNKNAVAQGVGGEIICTVW